MRKLTVFNQVSIDGYFTGRDGDLSWAHRDDPEWSEFVAGNASGESVLLFGRVTYEMMLSFWPTPAARESYPAVAEGMHRMKKVVLSTSLREATWNNTTIARGLDDIERLRNEPGPDLVLLGSGNVVSQLAAKRLIDEYQIAVYPTTLGAGRTMFEDARVALKLTSTRIFRNGNVLLCYEPA